MNIDGYSVDRQSTDYTFAVLSAKSTFQQQFKMVN